MVEEKKVVSVGSLKEGNLILIDDNVCKIKTIDKSKPGKHGSAKARIVAIGIFDNQKRNLLKPTSAETEIPIIEKGNAQVLAVVGTTIHIMDIKSYETIQCLKPAEIGSLKQGDEVEYIRYGKNIAIIRKKS